MGDAVKTLSTILTTNNNNNNNNNKKQKTMTTSNSTNNSNNINSNSSISTTTSDSITSAIDKLNNAMEQDVQSLSSDDIENLITQLEQEIDGMTTNTVMDGSTTTAQHNNNNNKSSSSNSSRRSQEDKNDIDNESNNEIISDIKSFDTKDSSTINTITTTTTGSNSNNSTSPCRTSTIDKMNNTTQQDAQDDIENLITQVKQKIDGVMVNTSTTTTTTSPSSTFTSSSTTTTPATDSDDASNSMNSGSGSGSSNIVMMDRDNENYENKNQMSDTLSSSDVSKSNNNITSSKSDVYQDEVSILSTRSSTSETNATPVTNTIKNVSSPNESISVNDDRQNKEPVQIIPINLVNNDDSFYGKSMISDREKRQKTMAQDLATLAFQAELQRNKKWNNDESIENSSSFYQQKKQIESDMEIVKKYVAEKKLKKEAKRAAIWKENKKLISIIGHDNAKSTFGGRRMLRRTPMNNDDDDDDGASLHRRLNNISSSISSTRSRVGTDLNALSKSSNNKDITMWDIVSRESELVKHRNQKQRNSNKRGSFFFFNKLRGKSKPFKSPIKQTKVTTLQQRSKNIGNATRNSMMSIPNTSLTKTSVVLAFSLVMIQRIFQLMSASSILL